MPQPDPIIAPDSMVVPDPMMDPAAADPVPVVPEQPVLDPTTVPTSQPTTSTDADTDSGGCFVPARPPGWLRGKGM